MCQRAVFGRGLSFCSAATFSLLVDDDITRTIRDPFRSCFICILLAAERGLPSGMIVCYPKRNSSGRRQAGRYEHLTSIAWENSPSPRGWQRIALAFDCRLGGLDHDPHLRLAMFSGNMQAPYDSQRVVGLGGSAVGISVSLREKATRSS